MPSREVFFIEDFRGGLNTDKTNRHTEKNELKEALNVEYSERGGVQKRKPYNVFHSFPTDRTVEGLLEWNMSGGNSELMAVLDNGDMIKVSDGTTVFNSAYIASGFDYEVLQEYLYILDGNDYYRVDDIEFNQEVVQAKDSSYYEYFAEERRDISLDTEYNLEYDKLKDNSETVQDSFGEEGEYTKDTDYTIDYPNGTITFLSGGSISSGQNIYIEYEYFVESDVDLSNIRKCTMLEMHNKSNRFFATGNPDDPSAIYYSELLEPDNFKGYSVVYPTTNDGPVQGIETLNDMLLVFYKNSVWAWRGIDPQQDAVWEKLPLLHGTYNGKTLQLTQNTLTFIDLDGIYSLNSLKEAQNITEDKVSNVIKSIANKGKVQAIFNSAESKYILAYAETDSKSNKLLVGDWTLGSYAIWEIPDITDIVYTLDGEVYLSSGNEILTQSDSYDTNVTMRIRTKEVLLQNPYSDKLITRVYVSLSNYTPSTTLKVILDDGVTKTFDVTSKTQRFDIQHNSVSVQLELEDTSAENIIIYDFGIEYKAVSTYRSDKR